MSVRPGLARLLRAVLGRLAALAAALAVVEVLAALIFVVLEHSWFSYTELQERRDLAIEVSGGQPDLPQKRIPRWMHPEDEVVHPYTGWVLDPTRPGVEGVHEYGFHELEAAFLPPDPGRVVIAFFGGSFAGQIRQEESTLLEELSRYEKWSERQLVVVDASLAGYKQPQQCMAMSYLLTIGAHFDLVVNIDGFNDIVLPWFDNARNGTFPFFPRVWPVRTASIADEQMRRGMVAVETLKERRSGLARWFSAAVPRRLVSANLVWALMDAGVQREVRDHERQLLSLAAQTSYQQAGPRAPTNRREVLVASAEVWARSSRLMEAVARQEGFHYFHFLQPNQYLEGSKPLHPAERRIAFRPDAGYGPHARDGYPLLVAAGEQLADSGVHFFDLTMMFAGEERAVYADPCCHVNELGMELVARRIGVLIRETLEGS